jgi:AcrR family transcriptional regulator
MSNNVTLKRRLTRAEAKARTRGLLLEAAGDVFARKGFAAASVEEIAETAGFSTGALYSNFAGKEELFAELLSSQGGDRLAEAARIVADEDASPEDRRKALGRLLVADKDADTAPLQAELWLYAIRKPELRELLSSQFRAARDSLAQILAAKAGTRDGGSEVPPDAVATALLALFQGLVQLRRIDPADVPEDLYASAIRWLFAGIAAVSRETPGRPGEC